MEADIGERENLQDKHPEIVAQLTALLQKYADAGRSTPGAPRENDVPVDIYKKPRPAAATKTK
jgi:hypothetical protein